MTADDGFLVTPEQAARAHLAVIANDHRQNGDMYCALGEEAAGKRAYLIADVIDTLRHGDLTPPEAREAANRRMHGHLAHIDRLTAAIEYLRKGDIGKREFLRIAEDAAARSRSQERARHRADEQHLGGAS